MSYVQSDLSIRPPWSPLSLYLFREIWWEWGKRIIERSDCIIRSFRLCVIKLLAVTQGRGEQYKLPSLILARLISFPLEITQTFCDLTTLSVPVLRSVISYYYSLIQSDDQNIKEKFFQLRYFLVSQKLIHYSKTSE